ncbi:MAG: phosphocholine cytidylyltransferase family protein [Oligoflexia bacterium]|nr:phosphocholine cytidylyltransferase family protein [Oligoflexia bacterium]
MVKTAVILAAGLGSRLGHHTVEKPKAFLKVGEETLIKRSIRNLLDSGIKKIIIGTGYKKHFFEELKEEFKELEFVNNDIYTDTSSMYTLYLMKDVIFEDFLLLESDLLYSKSLITEALNSTKTSLIMSSKVLDNGDEVFLESDSSGNLTNLSKNKKDLSSIHSVLTGVSKVSLKTYERMCQYFSESMDKKMKLDYEHVFRQISSDENIYLNKNDDIPWCEIDDENHLKYAINHVLPKL